MTPDFVQQLVSGIALVCVYGLIALGFVLVYKATEVVNFAQGDLITLAGFFAFTFIGMLGLNYCEASPARLSRWRCSACWPSAWWCALFSAIAVFHHHEDHRLWILPRSVVGMICTTISDRDAVQPGVLRIGSLVLAMSSSR